MSEYSNRSQLLAFVAGILAVIAVPLSFQLWEELDAGQVMVIQSPVDGKLTWHTTPGPKWQGFGKVTKYNLRDQLWFIDPMDNEKIPDDAQGQPSIEIRFNDGGHARINGSIAYEIPLDTVKLTELHSRYGNQNALEQQVVRSIVEKCIYMTGPLMSSTESYASRRNELLGDIEDQVQNGVYKTEARDARVHDEATGEEKTVKQVHIVMDKANKPAREQESLLGHLGMKAYNLSVRRVKYDDTVEQQIQKQQQSAAQAQQAVVEAKTAEQRKLTAKAEAEAVQAKLVGEANAKKAEAITKAEAEVAIMALSALKEKTNAVIQAQQKFEVASLETKTAEQFKKSEEFRGQGEAARRKAVLDADGALEKKLEAWVQVNKAYADALTKYQGAIVPSVVMGQSGGTPITGVDNFQQMLQILGAKAAKDLAIDITPSGSTKK